MSARDALLICNGEYDDAGINTLPSAQGDLQGLTSVLADPEIGAFNVISLSDVEVQEARIAIARFCMDREGTDTILVYFSGHGIKDESGRLFLALRDTQLNVLSATGLSSQFLLDELSRSPAKYKALILDCLYAGAILRDVSAPRDLAILASSGAMQDERRKVTSPDGFWSATVIEQREEEFQAGRFTAALIQGMRSGDADHDGDGTVMFHELFRYASRVVELTQEGKQIPRLFDLTEKPIVAAKAVSPIFISYSRSDMEFASALGDELSTAGYKVWMDTKGISGGEDWAQRIGTAIDASKLVLAVLSTEALTSSWVRRELSYADDKRKPILPIIYRACELPSWYKLQFGRIQRLDLTAQAKVLGPEPLLSSVRGALQSRSL